LNEYELMLILHPRLNADEANAMVETVQGRITGAGGEMISTDVWGRRRLAYPIQHVLEGTYVLMTFQLEPARTRTIESWLGISESVLRHLLIRGIIPYEGPSRSDVREERPAAYEADDEDVEHEDDAAPAAEAVADTAIPEAAGTVDAGVEAGEPSEDEASDDEAGEPAAAGEAQTRE
jgi:small subunit ribosomal protein S6